MKFGAGSEDKPKPKGALAALVVGGAPSSTPSLPGEDDHGFKALAKAFGIPPEREAAAKAALKQYVRECVSSLEGEEEPDPLSEEY